MRRIATQRASRSAIVALSALLGGLVGCGGGDSAGADSGTAGGGDGGIGCLGDPRADTYTANMEKPGDQGVFSFVLESSDPAPPVKGTNNWVLQVLDGSGAPVTGATIDVVPYMPDHGHGTSVTPQVSAGDNDDYNLDSLYLFMPGLWQVTITADTGDQTDSVKYNFCIQG